MCNTKPLHDLLIFYRGIMLILMSTIGVRSFQYSKEQLEILHQFCLTFYYLYLTTKMKSLVSTRVMCRIRKKLNNFSKTAEKEEQLAPAFWPGVEHKGSGNALLNKIEFELILFLNFVKFK